jgi:4-aminobutyrate aminotransferase/(S)-3-amino-2-methylpropionate transaminase
MGRYAQVNTPLPGPRSREILERKERFVGRPFDVHLPAVIQSGSGALLTDVDGNTFIDLAGGVGVMNVGHGHPRVLAAIEAQARRFTHTDFTVAPYESFIDLAERLCGLAPGPSPKKAVFFNSGAEAVENAVKIARYVTGRKAVIAFEGAFHGRTLMAMSLTSKTMPYKRGFGAMAAEVYRVPFPYAYRLPEGVVPAHASAFALGRLEEAFRTLVNPAEVAAVIIEPVLGEGGFVPAPPEFLQGLRDLTKQHGILLIADEVQTGYGRTGTMFAVEQAGIEPDLLVVAKSIAAGLPLSGVVARSDLLDAVHEGGLGGTYVGNPVACAAALAVLDVMRDEGLVERAQLLGRRYRERFLAWQDRYDLVGDVRGLGAMMAVELVRSRTTKEPAKEETGKVLRLAMERGVLALSAGVLGNVIRVLAPLVITEAQQDEALDLLEESLAQVARQPVTA